MQQISLLLVPSANHQLCIARVREYRKVVLRLANAPAMMGLVRSVSTVAMRLARHHRRRRSAQRHTAINNLCLRNHSAGCWCGCRCRCRCSRRSRSAHDPHARADNQQSIPTKTNSIPHPTQSQHTHYPYSSRSQLARTRVVVVACRSRVFMGCSPQQALKRGFSINNARLHRFSSSTVSEHPPTGKGREDGIKITFSGGECRKCRSNRNGGFGF